MFASRYCINFKDCFGYVRHASRSFSIVFVAAMALAVATSPRVADAQTSTTTSLMTGSSSVVYGSPVNMTFTVVAGGVRSKAGR